MSVTSQTPYNSYTANGATTVFPYGYLLLDTDDLVVTVDGVEVALTTDYTVSGVGTPSGGNVTFLAAPANDAKVLLARLLTIQRLTDYQDNGDLFAETINRDLDRLWLALQQLQQNDIRALKLPFDTATDQTITEAVSSRVGKIVSFDASGNMMLATQADLSMVATISAFMESLFDDPNAATARATLGAAASGAIGASGLTGQREQGIETVFVPAGAMTARTTSGAALGFTETAVNKIMLKSMDFADGASKLYAQFAVRMPKSWDAGTVTAEFAWTANSTSTNGVVWGIQGVSLGNDETIDAAFGAAQEVTDANTATAYQVHLSGATAAVTISGAGNSEWVVFQVYRDPTNGSDTLAATAMLLGVTLKYTTNAVNDA